MDSTVHSTSLCGIIGAIVEKLLKQSWQKCHSYKFLKNIFFHCKRPPVQKCFLKKLFHKVHSNFLKFPNAFTQRNWEISIFKLVKHFFNEARDHTLWYYPPKEPVWYTDCRVQIVSGDSTRRLNFLIIFRNIFTNSSKKLRHHTDVLFNYSAWWWRPNNHKSDQLTQVLIKSDLFFTRLQWRKARKILRNTLTLSARQTIMNTWAVCATNLNCIPNSVKSNKKSKYIPKMLVINFHYISPTCWIYIS